MRKLRGASNEARGKGVSDFLFPISKLQTENRKLFYRKGAKDARQTSSYLYNRDLQGRTQNEKPTTKNQELKTFLPQRREEYKDGKTHDSGLKTKNQEQKTTTHPIPVIGLTILLLALNFVTLAQDLHFTQYDHSFLNLNPALAGQFEGSYRFNGNYRRQWNAVTTPFRTINLAVDARDFLRLKNFNAGIKVWDDRAGDSRFTTTTIGTALGYSFELPNDKQTKISIGVLPTFTRVSIDPNQLRFDRQYNGFTYDGHIGNGETFLNTQLNYFDLATGIALIQPINKHKVTLGFSAFNLLNPSEEFISGNIEKPLLVQGHAAAIFYLTEEWDLLPSFILRSQGPHSELMAGSTIRYVFNRKSYNFRAVRLGGNLRLADAGNVILGLDYDQWYFGVSYDFNYSTLRTASNVRGGAEFSVVYILPPLLPKRKKFKNCPEFL